MTEMDHAIDYAIECVKEKYGTAGLASDLERLREDTVELIHVLLDAMHDPHTEEEQESYDAAHRAAAYILRRFDKVPEPPESMKREDDSF